MSDDNSNRPKNTPQNPWGAPQSGGSSSNNGGGSGNLPPEIEAIFKRARNQMGGGGGRPTFGTGGGMAPFPFSPKTILLGVLGVAVLWIGSGLFRVQPGEQAVIQRFGAYHRLENEPGLKFALPWPVDKVTKINASLDRRMQIGFIGDGNNATNIEEESLMLTSDANIVDVRLAVLWNITEANKFIFNIRDPENTIKQVAQSAIREVIGQTTLQTIINGGRDTLSGRIRSDMQEILDSYDAGVNISQVLVLQNQVHPDVLESFKDVVAAKQDAERFQNEAMIYKNDALPKARGESSRLLQEAEAYKTTQVTKARGDADRFNSVIAAYRSGEAVTKDRIYIETMEQVMQNAQKIVIDPGTGGILPYLPLSNKTGGAQ